MDFTSIELDLMYELARKEANRLCVQHGWDSQFEPGSWSQTVLDLNRKLTANLHARRQGCI